MTHYEYHRAKLQAAANYWWDQYGSKDRSFSENYCLGRARALDFAIKTLEEFKEEPKQEANTVFLVNSGQHYYPGHDNTIAAYTDKATAEAHVARLEPEIEGGWGKGDFDWVDVFEKTVIKGETS